MEKRSNTDQVITKCEKCIELREVEESQATSLILCPQTHDDILEVMSCDYHCNKQFGMCSACFEFIQDPKNDAQLRKWEEKHANGR